MIYGNRPVTDLIDRAVNHDRLSHAYLFFGEHGLGKKMMATCFAKAILCKGTHRPCGECESCKKMAANAHPDFVTLSGGAKKNELTVKNIRALKAEASVYPNDGDKKVYLISDCQKMMDSASNALLKLLEEPPEHLVILLTVDDRSHVLPTILSRCIPIGVYPVGEEECAKALSVLCGLEEAVAAKVARVCGGNIGKALGLFTKDDLPVSPDDFCLMLVKRQEYGMAAALSKLAGDRDEYRLFLEAVFERFRDAAVLKSGGERIVAGSKDAAQALIGSFTAKQLLERIRVLSRAMRDLDSNANISSLSSWIVSTLSDTAILMGK